VTWCVVCACVCVCVCDTTHVMYPTVIQVELCRKALCVLDEAHLPASSLARSRIQEVIATRLRIMGRAQEAIDAFRQLCGALRTHRDGDAAGSGTIDLAEALCGLAELEFMQLPDHEKSSHRMVCVCVCCSRTYRCGLYVTTVRSV